MTLYRVDISPEAASELEENYEFIAEDSPENAARWYFSMHDKIQTLKEFPHRCPLADENRFYDFEIRHLLIGNFRVLYRIQGTTVQILHVKRGSMERKPI